MNLILEHSRSERAARRLFTVDEFHRMAEVNILNQDDRVELMEGELIVMSPIGKRHAAVVARLTSLFAPLAKEVVVWVQNPLLLGDSEVYPDMALLKARAGFYADALPTAHDVLLLIEVADTTLAYDQRIKTPLYARAGVTEVWIVDLAGEKVWVYREPSAEGYLEMKVKQQGERLSMEHRTLQLDSDGILVDDFLD